MMNGIGTGDRSGLSDALATAGLFLNVGAVISAAVWLGMVVGSHPSGSSTLTGVLTPALFAAGWACFAVDRPPRYRPRQ